MKKNMRILVLLAATMSLLALGACNLFAPRQAENPKAPPPWNTFFINPTLTMQNLQYSYDQQENALKFGDIISPNFTFHFAVQDVNDYSTPATWNADSEKEMLVNLHKNLLNSDEQMTLVLSPSTTQADQIMIATAWIYRSYVIKIEKRSNELSIYAGQCAIFLESDNGFWKIRDWYDYRTGLSSSWGQLKYFQDNQ